MALSSALPGRSKMHADAIPPAIKARLSGAEIRARIAEMSRLHDSAASAPAEHSRHLIASAQKVSRAQPVCCHIERTRELRRRIDGASTQAEYDPVTGRSFSVASSHRSALAEHEAEAHYPSGLVAAVDNAMLDRQSTPDATAIAEHHAKQHGK